MVLFYGISITRISRVVKKFSSVTALSANVLNKLAISHSFAEQFDSSVRKLLLLFAVLVISCFMAIKSYSQFLMDMVDTTKEVGMGLLSVYKKYDHLKIGGYLQPQFQIAANEGIRSFEGGDFGSRVSNRFMIRRSRVRIDYLHFNKTQGPGVQIVFQFDANERGFSMRDVWGRIFENKYQLFSFTSGMFARPFGYEVNLSSSDRESPERGRMSQTLMKSERDLGAMISFEPRKKIGKLSNLKMDIGLFNGQGINASGDFDNSKDLIARVSLKPVALSARSRFSMGVSMLQGGLVQNTKYVSTTGTVNGSKTMVVDSSAGNLFTDAPRKYYGIDAQLKIGNGIGYSEFRAEYLSGQQTGTAFSSETPTQLLSGTDGFHVRRFNGAYFYYLQHLFSLKHQLVIKYDWYDPNTQVRGKEIGAPGSNLSAANIKYQTLGIGYLNYLSENIKLVVYYAFVKNEATLLPGYTEDVKDNVFTLRVQYRF